MHHNESRDEFQEFMDAIRPEKAYGLFLPSVFSLQPKPLSSYKKV
jgi:hypothetical protein